MEVAIKSTESGYRVGNFKIEGYVCKTNCPSNTAFRGFGHPQAVAIMEDVVFKIANKLNISSEKVI
jgi:xanthine dehydrogenase molybdopterin-binding subunit B